jgi:hypothetical protein
MMKTLKLLPTAFCVAALSLGLNTGAFSKGKDFEEKEKNSSGTDVNPTVSGPFRKKAVNQSGSNFQKAPANTFIMREMPSHYFRTNKEAKTDSVPFKPSISVGSIVHMFASSQQTGFGSNTNYGDAGSDWNKGITLYRARVLVGGQLSKKGSFFLETDIPSPIGVRLDSSTKNVKVSPIILDAQYEHTFNEHIMLVAGMQLVSHNRNGLQGAASLMANDFTYYQYPYNLFANDPLQGNFGRDLGLNARGFFLKKKLEYRFGIFSGRRFDDKAPFRTVGRVVYNFLDPEQDYYYAGTKLGAGKTVALAAGFDAQATYYNVGADLFVDVPVSQAGSVTLNSAFTYMSGGTKTDTKYSFARMIPQQTVSFLELGYYFKDIKVQPWVRFENKAVSAAKEQAEGDVSTFNKLQGGTVFGGGVNYFFNGYGTNVRLSYTTFTKGVPQDTGDITNKTYGQLWCQLQFFIF